MSQIKLFAPRLIRFLVILVVAYLSVVLLLFVFQRSLIYFPSPEYEHSFSQISLNSGNENIEVIVLNPNQDHAFIYFGGNAEAVIVNAKPFSLIFPSMTIYLVNYRGYGGSSGQATEAGLFSDAVAVFDHFSSAHKGIAVVGRSLGSGVAMHLAANRPVSHAILITPFDSLLALAQNQYPIFPISRLLIDKYDSLSIADRVTAPVLILAGGRDTLIPLSHSMRLLNKIGQDNAQISIIEQAGHNDIANFQQFNESIIAFLTK